MILILGMTTIFLTAFAESDPVTIKNEISQFRQFMDPNKTSEYYLDRYNEQGDYKNWFDENFPNITIYEALGFATLELESEELPKRISVVIEGYSYECDEGVNECYIPDSVTIGINGKVTWMNVDSSVHTVVSGKPTDNVGAGNLFHGILVPDAEFTIEFDRDTFGADDYPYFCVIHPWMTGKVTVVMGDDDRSSDDPSISSVMTKKKDLPTRNYTALRTENNPDVIKTDTPERPVVDEKDDDTSPDPIDTNPVMKKYNEYLRNDDNSNVDFIFDNRLTEEFYEQITSMHKFDLYERAISTIDRELRSYPENAELFRLKAYTLYLNGDYDDVIEISDERLKDYPDSITAMRYKIIASEQLSKSSALRAINDLLEENPKNEELFFFKTSILNSLNRYQDVADASEDRLEEYPESETSYDAKVQALKNLQYTDELTDFQKDRFELHKDNDNSDYYNYEFYETTRNLEILEEAANDLVDEYRYHGDISSPELVPTKDSFFNPDVIDAYIELGRLNDALKMIDDVEFSIPPVDSEDAESLLLSYRADIQRELKEYDDALDSIKKGFEILDEVNPSSNTRSKLYLSKALVLEASKEYDDALDSINMGLDTFNVLYDGGSKHLPYYQTKADVLIELGREEDALQIINEGIDEYPSTEYPSLLVSKITLLQKLDRDDEAKETCDEIGKSDARKYPWPDENLCNK